MMNDHLKFILHIADNSLILGQRLGEWCGHGPVLEQDIALTNIALDLIGQARLYYQHAQTMDPDGRDEDALAFTREELEYFNCLLVEQPNTDFAYTIARQYFFDVHHFFHTQKLLGSGDKQIAAIAEKSLKEIRYHLKYSSEWMLRLGDGTEESHNRLQQAVNDLWEYTGELFIPAGYEVSMATEGIGPDLETLAPLWTKEVSDHLQKATLELPASAWMQRGGKEGYHTEQMGYVLTELQYMQRTYPGQKW